jgi:uncharacterized protein (TIGR03905 family)
MKHIYKTKGVCSNEIQFETDGNAVTKVAFTGGCHGNLIAISRLVEGLPIEEVISKLKGIKCRPSGDSCADQLVQALEQTLEK